MRGLNAFMAMILASIGLDQADGHFLINTNSVVSSRAMYTADWISKSSPFTWVSGFVMEFATLHGINENAPYWESEVTLTNHTHEVMAGFVAFQSKMFDPLNQSRRDWRFGDLCKHRADFESGSMGNHNVQFEDWRFDPIADSSSELRLNATQPIHESGLWINIVHLCVTEGHRRGHWAVTMHAHQTAVNPLGFIGGELLMAFPVMMLLLILYGATGFLWMFQMVIQRQNIIRWIHWPLAVGIALGFLETMLRFNRFYTVNVHGFLHLTRNRLIVDATAKIVVLMYHNVMMVVLCGGVGIARTGLGRKTKVFLAFYIVTHCAVFARIEYLEFFVLIHGRFGASNLNEMRYLCRYLVVSQVVLFVMSFFNLHGVLDRLERNGQHFKIGIYNSLAVLVVFVAIALIELESTGNSVAVHEFVDDSSKWIMYYLMRDGFKRLLSALMLFVVLLLFMPHSESLRLVLSDQIEHTETDVDLDDSHDTEPEDEQTPNQSATAHEDRNSTPTPLPLPSWISETTDSL